MHCIMKPSVFVWLSFIYQSVSVASLSFDESGSYNQKSLEIYLKRELQNLPLHVQYSLLDNLQRQSYHPKRSASEEVSSEELNDFQTILKDIRSGYAPIVRNRRTLEFLITSLADVVLSRVTNQANNSNTKNQNAKPNNAVPAGPIPPPATPEEPKPAGIIPPGPMPSAPKATGPMPAGPMPAGPLPAGPMPAPTPIPTIPQDQIDANTIRYPFRPAPAIPFLTFAPLPAGVTVPYPPLLQWPQPANATTAPPPTACAPPAKCPPPPPLPAPSQPPAPKESPPVLSKPPVKSLNIPLRIDLLNGPKQYLPMSGSVYSGESGSRPPTEQNPYLEAPETTEGVHLIIGEEARRQFDKPRGDDVYTPFSMSDYFNDDEDDDGYDAHESFHEYNHPEENDFSQSQRHVSYPENIEKSTESYQGYSKTAAFPFERSRYQSQPSRDDRSSFNSFLPNMNKPENNLGVRSPPFDENSRKSSLDKTFNFQTPSHGSSQRIHKFYPQSVEIPYQAKNRKFGGRPEMYDHNASKLSSKQNEIKYPSALRYEPNPSLTSSFQNTQPESSFRSLSNELYKFDKEGVRSKRDVFFDEAFKHFNLSALDYFSDEPFPISTQSQFLEFNTPIQITPDDLYRQKLEKDVESYVEQYVEKQINDGEINTDKPKTTVIELKRKNGPPIKTVTTTVSKLINGDKSLTDAILEFSKNINPVSNIGDFVGESQGGADDSLSEVKSVDSVSNTPIESPTQVEHKNKSFDDHEDEYDDYDENEDDENYDD